ncbi:hypothetical protein BD310DRAFT_906747 [Dichomitus squalens]|uniref:Uncharacterized protein n=1 Tax=Dichomitus squalens TaxID=114155 RepID=A0A4Q9PUF9_9APHY|nr:hypothetical protein BD310DRAFT_906747 [Dichomitus squalens]
MWRSILLKCSILLRLKTLFVTDIQLLFLVLFTPVAVVSFNFTVDDTFGNNAHTVIPAYLPNNGTWHVGSPTEQCNGCIVQPSELDISQIMNQTWHHATFFDGAPIQMEVTFPGTAVYVYNILPNTLPGGVSSHTNLLFSIDGETVGQFSHVSDSSAKFLYNQLVYWNASLSKTTHTLVMRADVGSLVIFDYMIYTMVDSLGSSASPNSSAATGIGASHSPSHVVIGAIIGPVIGVVVIILLAAVLEIFILRRKRRRLDRPASDSFSPIDAITPSKNTSFGRPVTLLPRSPNAATQLPLPVTSSQLSQRSFEAQREAELTRRLYTLQREMRSLSYQENISEDESRLSSSAVQALQEEIAALRGVLSSMAMRVEHHPPPISESLPRYEDAHLVADTSRERTALPPRYAKSHSG